MKILGMILLLGLITSCDPEEIAELANQKACSVNYEEDLAEYEEGLADGSISEDTAAPRECGKLLPSDEANLGVSIVMRDFDDDQEVKMLEAIEKIKIAINSQEFKDRVLNHTYNKQKQFYFYKSSEKISNEEVYQRILTGAEVLIPEEDAEIDIDVTLYYENSNTVGKTRKTTTRTWFNEKYFNPYTHAQISKNVVHEWMHKLGFTHTSKRTSRRPYSVPYAVGYIIEDLVEEL